MQAHVLQGLTQFVLVDVGGPEVVAVASIFKGYHQPFGGEPGHVQQDLGLEDGVAKGRGQGPHELGLHGQVGRRGRSRT